MAVIRDSRIRGSVAQYLSAITQGTEELSGHGCSIRNVDAFAHVLIEKHAARNRKQIQSGSNRARGQHRLFRHPDLGDGGHSRGT